MFGGRVLVASGWKPGFSTDFDECVKRAILFREALYATPLSEIIEQNLTFTLELRTAVAEVTIYIGEKHLSSLDSPDKTGMLIWTEAAPKGAKASISR